MAGMKDFFLQDKTSVGLVTALGSIVVVSLLVWLVLSLLGLPIAPNFRWFVLGFVPAVIIYRFYVKAKVYPTVAKIQIITIFVLFVLFMFLLQKVAAIQL